MSAASRRCIVLAYSGNAVTTAAIPWLKGRHLTDVVTVTLDLGQGQELEAVRARALAAGAARAHVLDVREAFARDYVIPALQAGVQDANGDPLADALAHPLIASTLIEIAAMEQASGVAHGARRHQAQLDALIRALSPDTVICTPADEVQIGAGAGATTSLDWPLEWQTPRNVNLWATTLGVPARNRLVTDRARHTPRETAYITVLFDHGVPVGINDVVMPFVELVASLTTLAAAHGLGRLDNPATAANGEDRRVVECPAALVLLAAHRELQAFVAPPGLDDVCAVVSAAYIDVVREGLWFTALRDALAALVAKVQERVTGSVRLQLAAGVCQVVGLTSPFGPDDPSAPAVGLKPDTTDSLVTQ